MICLRIPPVICLATWVCLSICSEIGMAATIEKPAGDLPIPKTDHSSAQQRSHSSKSKVVPLQRRFDLATSQRSNRTKVVDVKRSAKTTIPPVAAEDKRPRNLMTITKSLESQAHNETDAGVAAVTSDEKWDSAVKRYDTNDPAASVSNGVRVEDIIEPTVDYRYSGARRKNPFIPEIILSGYISRQRELSPNDVEIPIVSPLQAFSVSKLAVIGVWETDQGVWKALIGTPATQGIEAKLGDPVGNSGGRIMSITPESVVVREFSLRSDGTREYRDIPLHMGSDLPKEADGKIGGRLILRPGSTQPEVVAPEVVKNTGIDAIISTSSEVVPGSKPGTLKTVEQVMVPEDDAANGYGEDGGDQSDQKNGNVEQTAPNVRGEK